MMQRVSGSMPRSTVTGLTFAGDPNPWLGILIGIVVAVAVWLLIGRLQHDFH